MGRIWLPAIRELFPALGKISYECREMEIWPTSDCCFYYKSKPLWRILGFWFTWALVIRSDFYEEHHEPNCRAGCGQKQKTREAHCPSPSLTLPGAFPWHYPQPHQPFPPALFSVLSRKPSPKLNIYPSLFLEMVLTQMLLHKRTLESDKFEAPLRVRVHRNLRDWVLIWSPGWPHTAVLLPQPSS